MSSHADTIRCLLGQTINGSYSRERGIAALDALLAENAELQRIIDEELAQVNRRFSEKRAENEQLRAAARAAMDELGVLQPDYLQPVANAYKILREAVRG